ncbi:MAG TPA: S8 family serine peptidase, partial [Pyrinomonadaceae bacterium]|nr:S8 family serine peptidase [Pyrinomonadaceae bacterium]
MKNSKRSPLISLITIFSLMVSLCSGILITDSAQAMPSKGSSNGNSGPGNGNGNGRAAKVSLGLSQRANRSKGKDGTVRVIVQFDGKPSSEVNSILHRNGIKVREVFKNFDARAIELPVSAVEELAAFDEVDFISEDSEINSLGHVSATTGTDTVRNQTVPTLLGGATSYTLDGSGIGIAVLDSGIDVDHKSFLGANDKSRVIFSRDFTGENRTDDPYGHGTHVASTVAGNGRVANAKYIGVAPNANLINLRVLNKNGAGTVSGLLSALDWLLNNRAVYNVRVVNMSLGVLAVDSYKNDPICKAVRRLVDLGVVVVAAAGNNGKNSAGQKLYGQIHSPGIEPSAITVGASNTFGTDSRADDAMTTYSSRG